MTYIIVIFYVFGVSIIIKSFFEFFGVYLDDLYNYTGSNYEVRPLWQKFIMKPTIYCNVCMSSFWGSVCYWVHLQGSSVNEWVLHCVIAVVGVIVVSRILDKLG